MGFGKAFKKLGKMAAQHVLAPVAGSIANVKNVAGATKTLLSGDTDKAAQQLADGYVDNAQAYATNWSGGMIKDSNVRRIQDNVKTAAALEEEQKKKEEMAALEGRTNTLLGRNKGRGFSNTLLGAGEV
jgi:hypothetical protein